MKFKQFINEEPILEPKFQKEFKKIGSKVKYKDRYKNIFGKEDRIYLPYSEKFSNRTVKNDDGDDYLIAELENLDFNYRILNKNKYFSKHLPVSTTSFEINDINIEDFNSKNKTVFVNFEIYYIAKHIGTKGDISIYADIPYKEFINLSTSSEVRKKQLIKMIEMNDTLLDSKNNGKEMKIVISRNPCDIGSMSTGTWWKSCMNLYTGTYSDYTRKDVKYGTLIAYLILGIDKDIKNPVGRVLIKPYIKGDKSKDSHLILSKRVYGYFPEKAKKTVQEWLDKQEKIPGDYSRHHKLYNDDDTLNVHVTNFKKGEKVEIKEFTRFNGKIGKITDIDLEDGVYNVKFKEYKKEYEFRLNNLKKITPEEGKK